VMGGASTRAREAATDSGTVVPLLLSRMRKVDWGVKSKRFRACHSQSSQTTRRMPEKSDMMVMACWIVLRFQPLQPCSGVPRVSFRHLQLLGSSLKKAARVVISVVRIQLCTKFYPSHGQRGVKL